MGTNHDEFGFSIISTNVTESSSVIVRVYFRLDCYN